MEKLYRKEPVVRVCPDKHLVTLPSLVKLVVDEEKRQLKKWGKERALPPSLWLTIVAEEFGELAKAMLEEEYDGSAEDVVNEAIQVATLALKIAEMYR